MLKNTKLILTVLAILAIIAIVWVVLSVVYTIVKVLLVLAVVIFAASIVKKLAGKSKPRELSENDSDRELNEAMRELEEIKRRQLIK